MRDDKCYTCGRRNPGLWGFGPALRNLGVTFSFAPMVIGASATIYVATLLLSGGAIRLDSIMALLAPSTPVLFLFGASGAIPVFTFGRWWTVLSAGWLHAGLLHIVLNMYWVRYIGPAMVDILGPARTIIVYVAAGVTGFALSSFAGAFLNGLPIPLLRGAGFTVGASAPVFGLIGALYHYGRTSSSIVKQQATYFAVQAIIFGLIFPGIDNYAHLGGFAGGYVMSAFFNPMTRERGDHMIVAVVLLAATLLSSCASDSWHLPCELHDRARRRLQMLKTLLAGTVVLSLAAAPAFAGQQPTTDKTPTAKAGGASDTLFVKNAAKGGLAEVELGQLAADHGASDQVKKFGQRMVTDHGKANDELKSLAQQKNIKLPTEIDATNKALHDRLSKLSGAAFDRAYMQHMLTDHRKDVNEFKREANSGRDPQMKSFASTTLPTLEEHLQHARQARQAATSAAAGN